MSAKLGICYCKLGMMATCVAINTDEQFWCDFFDRSRNDRKKCMYLDGAIDDHCSRWEAHDFSKIHGVVKRGEETPVEAYSAPKAVPEAKVPSATAAGKSRKTCLSCVEFLNCPLLTIEAAMLGKSITSLGEQDYWNIGSLCSQYNADGAAVGGGGI